MLLAKKCVHLLGWRRCWLMQPFACPAPTVCACRLRRAARRSAGHGSGIRPAVMCTTSGRPFMPAFGSRHPERSSTWLMTNLLPGVH